MMVNIEMTVKVAINGFGRIGRLLYRAAFERKASLEAALIKFPQ